MQIGFAGFALETATLELRRHGVAVRLRPRALEVLRYLVERPGVLVTKEQLIDALWPNVAITEHVLAVCISELRTALGDVPKAPRVIETVHRLGYRFIASIEPVSRDHSPGVEGRAELPRPQPEIVGRDAEWQALRDAFERALHGQRQIVFVTGDPGIGKTTLVDCFLSGLCDTSSSTAWIAEGQCVEAYGPGEPYMPVLEAVGRLAREQPRLVELLREHAPSWLLQLSGVSSAEEEEGLRRRFSGSTKDRMLRELAVGVEALTAETPLILVLEDLHWSDPSTVELLAALGQRRQPARLLAICTYRPVDVSLTAHPLRIAKLELARRGRCSELALELLPRASVEEYLTRRFPGLQAVGPLAAIIHQHSDGNPLFMTGVADLLCKRGVLARHDDGWSLSGVDLAVEVPRGLRQMVLEQLGELTAQELRILEAASVDGTVFTAPATAAGAQQDVENVAACCDELARGHRFIAPWPLSEWPDGTVAETYRFTHAFLRDAVYDRIPAARRRSVHQRIGDRLVTAYGERAADIAGELALRYQNAGDHSKAALYHGRAAETAVSRNAYGEAAQHLSAALADLSHLPATADRVRLEAAFLVQLGVARLNTHGFASTEAQGAFQRALSLRSPVQPDAETFASLQGLHSIYAVSGRTRDALTVGQQIVQLAECTDDPTYLLEAHHAIANSHWRNANQVLAGSHFEKVLEIYNPNDPVRARSFSGHDPKVCALGHLALVSWLAGYPDRAVARARESVALAVALSHPFTIALAQYYACYAHLLRREGAPARAAAEELVAVSEEHGMPFWAAIGTVVHGVARTLCGDTAGVVDSMQRGLEAYAATGGGQVEQHWMFAEACHNARAISLGLEAVALGLTAYEMHGEAHLAPELLRLRGDLLLTTGAESEAEAAFAAAMALARKQQSHSFELRAALSLGQLRARSGRSKEVCTLVAPIAARFSEGRETLDLRAAAALIGENSANSL